MATLGFLKREEERTYKKKMFMTILQNAHIDPTKWANISSVYQAVIELQFQCCVHDHLIREWRIFKNMYILRH